MTATGRYRLPPLNALRAFEAAARHLSFTRAAEELCIAQSAVSRHVHVLERRLGTPLFVRGHRHVTLTAEGEDYFRSVRQAFEGLDEATSRISKSPQADKLTLRLLPTFAMRWLVPRLARFNAENPSVAVTINTSHDHGDFDRDDMDAAVEYGNPPRTDLVVERLFGELLVPVCAPLLSYGLPPPGKPSDLHRHVLLHSMHRPDFWRQWLAEAGVSGIPVDRGLRFENSGLCYQAAVDGLGIAIAHVAFVQEDLAAGRLIVPFDLRMRAPMGYWLVYPERSLRQPKLRAFRDFILREAAATMRMISEESARPVRELRAS